MKLIEKNIKRLDSLKVEILHDRETKDESSYRTDRGELRGYLDCLEDLGHITKDEKFELLRYYTGREGYAKPM